MGGAHRFAPPRPSQQVGTYSVIGKEVQIRFLYEIGSVTNANLEQTVTLEGYTTPDLLRPT